MKPKKILHVANRADKHLGKRFYSFPHKINNGFIREGHNVFWFSDRDISRTSTPIPSRKFGVMACNRKLVEVCRNFKPEIIALYHADIITIETLMEVRGLLPDALILQYNIDGMATQGTIQKIRSKNGCIDWTFITTGGAALEKLSSSNAPASFIPNPVDASIDCLCNWQTGDFLYDLLLIASPAEWIDQDSLRALAFARLPDDPPGLRVLKASNLWGSDFIEGLAKAKMGISFNQIPPGEPRGKGSNLYLYSSDRIAQLMGNGLLTFTDSSFNLAELYGADALVEVENYDEFREKVAFFQRHDDARIAVARRGYELSHQEFNERLVVRYMLETVCRERYSHAYFWPTEKY